MGSSYKGLPFSLLLSASDGACKQLLKFWPVTFPAWAGALYFWGIIPTCYSGWGEEVQQYPCFLRNVGEYAGRCSQPCRWHAFSPLLQITGRESVVIVQGHVALEGVLLFGQKYFYICEHFTLSDVQEVYCTQHCLSRWVTTCPRQLWAGLSWTFLEVWGGAVERRILGKEGGSAGVGCHSWTSVYHRCSGIAQSALWSYLFL